MALASLLLHPWFHCLELVVPVPRKQIVLVFLSFAANLLPLGVYSLLVRSTQKLFFKKKIAIVVFFHSGQIPVQRVLWCYEFTETATGISNLQHVNLNPFVFLNSRNREK